MPTPTYGSPSKQSFASNTVHTIQIPPEADETTAILVVVVGKYSGTANAPIAPNSWTHVGGVGGRAPARAFWKHGTKPQASTVEVLTPEGYPITAFVFLVSGCSLITAAGNNFGTNTGASPNPVTAPVTVTLDSEVLMSFGGWIWDSGEQVTVESYAPTSPDINEEYKHTGQNIGIAVCARSDDGPNRTEGFFNLTANVPRWSALNVVLHPCTQAALCTPLVQGATSGVSNGPEVDHLITFPGPVGVGDLIVVFLATDTDVATNFPLSWGTGGDPAFGSTLPGYQVRFIEVTQAMLPFDSIAVSSAGETEIAWVCYRFVNAQFETRAATSIGVSATPNDPEPLPLQSPEPFGPNYQLATLAWIRPEPPETIALLLEYPDEYEVLQRNPGNAEISAAAALHYICDSEDPGGWLLNKAATYHAGIHVIGPKCPDLSAIINLTTAAGIDVEAFVLCKADIALVTDCGIQVLATVVRVPSIAVSTTCGIAIVAATAPTSGITLLTGCGVAVAATVVKTATMAGGVDVAVALVGTVVKPVTISASTTAAIEIGGRAQGAKLTLSTTAGIALQATAVARADVAVGTAATIAAVGTVVKRVDVAGGTQCFVAITAEPTSFVGINLATDCSVTATGTVVKKVDIAAFADAAIAVNGAPVKSATISLATSMRDNVVANLPRRFHQAPICQCCPEDLNCDQCVDIPDVLVKLRDVPEPWASINGDYLVSWGETDVGAGVDFLPVNDCGFTQFAGVSIDYVRREIYFMPNGQLGDRIHVEVEVVVFFGPPSGGTFQRHGERWSLNIGEIEAAGCGTGQIGPCVQPLSGPFNECFVPPDNPFCGQLFDPICGHTVEFEVLWP